MMSSSSSPSRWLGSAGRSLLTAALLAGCGGADPAGSGRDPGAEGDGGSGSPDGGSGGQDGGAVDGGAPDAPAGQDGGAGGPQLSGIDFDLVPLGSSFTVSGADLAGATEVLLGGVAQTSFTVESASALRVDPVDADTPLGEQELVVTTPLGTSAPLAVQIVRLTVGPGVLAHGGTAVVAADGFAFVDGETQATVGGIDQTVDVNAPDSATVGPLSDDAGAGTLALAMAAGGAAVAPVRVPVMHLVIAELDSDTPAAPTDDSLEFIELATGVAGASLDGYVLVLYDGDTDTSYAAFDLDGVAADADGVVLAGNPDVSPSPSPALTFPAGTLQNGADAAALYQGDAADFPAGSAIVTAGLIDAVVYGTSDADDAGLLALHGSGPQAVQVDEGQVGAESDAVARCAGVRLDGRAHQVVAPTPGAANGCP